MSMIQTRKMIDWKATASKWKALAKNLEQVVKAAAEFEYREFKNYETYTNRPAAEITQKRRDLAFDELRGILRDTGMIKRD